MMTDTTASTKETTTTWRIGNMIVLHPCILPTDGHTDKEDMMGNQQQFTTLFTTRTCCDPLRNCSLVVFIDEGRTRVCEVSFVYVCWCGMTGLAAHRTIVCRVIFVKYRGHPTVKVEYYTPLRSYHLCFVKHWTNN